MLISAYIPCFNNRAALPASIASIRDQAIPVDELFIVDDGSSDGSADYASAAGVEVIRHSSNLGRGAARSTAMERARGEIVLCLDANNILPSRFLSNALPWIDQSNVAAVFGRLSDPAPIGPAGRWRSRHLYKDNSSELRPNRKAILATGASIIRRTCVSDVGGYNPFLRHSEDSDLGQRLLAAGRDVIFDPSLLIYSNVRNTTVQVLERYWRWHAGKEPNLNLREYLKQVVYSAKVMARQDLQTGDLVSALISLASPHYQCCRTIFAGFERRCTRSKL